MLLVSYISVFKKQFFLYLGDFSYFKSQKQGQTKETKQNWVRIKHM